MTITKNNILNTKTVKLTTSELEEEFAQTLGSTTNVESTVDAVITIDETLTGHYTDTDYYLIVAYFNDPDTNLPITSGYCKYKINNSTRSTQFDVDNGVCVIFMDSSSESQEYTSWDLLYYGTTYTSIKTSFDIQEIEGNIQNVYRYSDLQSAIDSIEGSSKDNGSVAVIHCSNTINFSNTTDFNINYVNVPLYIIGHNIKIYRKDEDVIPVNDIDSRNNVTFVGMVFCDDLESSERFIKCSGTLNIKYCEFDTCATTRTFIRTAGDYPMTVEYCRIHDNYLDSNDNNYKGLFTVTGGINIRYCKITENNSYSGCVLFYGTGGSVEIIGNNFYNNTGLLAKHYGTVSTCTDNTYTYNTDGFELEIIPEEGVTIPAGGSGAVTVNAETVIFKDLLYIGKITINYGTKTLASPEIYRGTGTFTVRACSLGGLSNTLNITLNITDPQENLFNTFTATSSSVSFTVLVDMVDPDDPCVGLTGDLLFFNPEIYTSSGGVATANLYLDLTMAGSSSFNYYSTYEDINITPDWYNSSMWTEVNGKTTPTKTTSTSLNIEPEMRVEVEEETTSTDETVNTISTYSGDTITLGKNFTYFNQYTPDELSGFYTRLYHNNKDGRMFAGLYNPETNKNIGYWTDNKGYVIDGNGKWIGLEGYANSSTEYNFALCLDREKDVLSVVFEKTKGYLERYDIPLYGVSLDGFYWTLNDSAGYGMTVSGLVALSEGSLVEYVYDP